MSILQDVSPRGDPRIIFVGLLIIFVSSLTNILLQVTKDIGDNYFFIFYCLYIIGFLVSFYGYRKKPPKRYFFEEE